VPAGDFRLMLERAAGAGRFASLDRASSSRVDWPSGNTPYLYGAYFHDYLAAAHGAASLVRLADTTAGRIPYLGSGAYQKVFGKSLGALWQEFEAHTRTQAPAPGRAPGIHPPMAATRLTEHGFIVSAPAYAPDGRLFYSISNPDGFPALMELRPSGGPREVTSRVGGGRIAAARSEIVFDQLEFVRSVGIQSDLYAIALESGAVRRLSHEARAADPDLSPDGRTVVCTIEAADRRFLATLPAGRHDGVPVALVTEPGTHYASPRWSPDGRMIAAERQRLGGPGEIVLLDGASGAVVRVLWTSAHGRSVTPSWTPDGRSVLFASDADGGPFQVYRADLATGQVDRLVNAGETAQSPALSPDGETLVFVGYTTDGFDLFSVPWKLAAWVPSDAPAPDSPLPTPMAAGAGASPAPQDSEAANRGLTGSRPYSPWRTLLPRFWTPIIERDAGDTAFGAATAGADALGRHGYAAGASWSTRGRADWYAGYAYDRWRPTLFANGSDDTDSWLSGTVRTRTIDAGAALPFRTFRRTQSLFASVHASTERFECLECAPARNVAVDRRAVRVGWSFTTARTYGYSISREDGLRAAVSAEWVPRAFGSTGASRSVVLDFRGYAPAGPRHGVIALRGAAAGSWGDDRAVREFGAGGSGPAPAGPTFDREAIALVRGFDNDDLSGPRALAVNGDYRFPLVWIERGIGTWPVLLRSLHGAIFADAGAAWSGRLTRRERRASIGLELSADLVVGYALPLTFASGVAWRHDPTGEAKGATVFARLGRAF
jgi:Tol biopolymer transport system component